MRDKFIFSLNIGLEFFNIGLINNILPYYIILVQNNFTFQAMSFQFDTAYH